ncbi:hypothetical protein ACKS0A_01035 [Histoplasma ohiense]
MRVEPANAARHRTPDEILADIQLNKRVNVAFQHAPHYVARYNRLSNNSLPAPVDPIDRSWLFVRAVVPGHGDGIHVFEPGLGGHDM